MSDMKHGLNHMIAFAIVRIDPPMNFVDLDVCMTVKKVVWDGDEARREVDRLNDLNKDKACMYYCLTTRVQEPFPVRQKPTPQKAEDRSAVCWDRPKRRSDAFEDEWIEYGGEG